jgi:hypothetical protein
MHDDSRLRIEIRTQADETRATLSTARAALHWARQARAAGRAGRVLEYTRAGLLVRMHSGDRSRDEGDVR